MAATTAKTREGRRSRAAWIAIALTIMAVGLVWRLIPLVLSSFALKYGGSVLWAAMVYCFCAALLALATEMLRLYHQPWLDDFRLTLPGALLLGRIFSPWNLVAYAAGIGAAALCEVIVRRRASGANDDKVSSV